MIRWILVGILLVISIYLFSGKGGWLIAGYNTLSEEKKEKYNEKKLCRATGVFMLTVTIGITLGYILMGIDDSNKIALSFTIPFSIYFVLAVVALLLYTNKKCKK